MASRTRLRHCVTCALQPDEPDFLRDMKTRDTRHRLAIVLSGQIMDDSGFLALLLSCELTICADGGARHLHRLNRLPDLLAGDLDSIEEEDLNWLVRHSVPIVRFPSVKDETDAELAVEKAIQLLKDRNKNDESDLRNASIEIILLGALGGRPDHVLSNQLMAVKIAHSGYHVILSDGQSSLYTLIGPGDLVLDPQKVILLGKAVSIIPISPEITGLTYTGLVYPLQQATLVQGSCQGVSNQPVAGVPVTVHVDSGSLLVVITPEV